MPENPHVDYSKSLPKFDAIRNDLRSFRAQYTDDASLDIDTFRTEMIKVIQKHLPELTFDDAVRGMNEGVAAGDTFESERIKRNLAWAAMANLIDDLEKKARLPGESL